MSQTKTVQHFTYGGGKHRTIVTLASHPVNENSALTGTIADGCLLFNFSDGVASGSGGFDIYVESIFANFSLLDTSDAAGCTADTPDTGVGTVVASGSVSILSGTGTFEDILTGQTSPDCNGTLDKSTEATANAYTATSLVTANGCYLNTADVWADTIPVGQLKATGTIIVDWEARPGYYS